MAVEVRRVRAGEWEAVRDTRLRALADAPHAFRTRHEDAVRRPDRWWRDWTAGSADGDAQAAFLAWEDGLPVGLVAAFVENGRRWLIQMWTDPSVRGRGVGAALVEAVLEHARAAGDAEVYLEVRFDNDGARRLYERCGFVDTEAGVDERELRRAL